MGTRWFYTDIVLETAEIIDYMSEDLLTRDSSALNETENILDIIFPIILIP